MLATTCARTESVPRITVFGPHPLLTVAIERRPGDSDGGDDIHLHAGGQGVWVSRWRRARGRAGAVRLRRRRDRRRCCGRCWSALPGERRLVETAGRQRLLRDRPARRRADGSSRSPGPRRRPAHELDDLFSATCAAALAARRSWSATRTRATPAARRCTPTWSRTSAATAIPVYRRPLRAAARQRAGGAARPRQAQRLGAGGVRVGPGGHAGAAARRCAERLIGARRRHGRGHPGRRARPGGSRRRRALELVPPRLRPRLARGLRRLDDGRDGGGACAAATSWERGAACWAPPPARPTSSATAWARGRRTWSRRSLTGSSAACASSTRVRRRRRPRRGGSRPARPRAIHSTCGASSVTCASRRQRAGQLHGPAGARASARRCRARCTRPSAASSSIAGAERRRSR